MEKKKKKTSAPLVIQNPLRFKLHICKLVPNMVHFCTFLNLNMSRDIVSMRVILGEQLKIAMDLMVILLV